MKMNIKTPRFRPVSRPLSRPFLPAALAAAVLAACGGSSGDSAAPNTKPGYLGTISETTIARSGQTGNVSSPQLHFELRRDGARRDVSARAGGGGHDPDRGLDDAGDTAPEARQPGADLPPVPIDEVGAGRERSDREGFTVALRPHRRMLGGGDAGAKPAA